MLGAHLLYLRLNLQHFPLLEEKKCSFDFGGLVLISNARIKGKNEWLSDRNF